MGRCCWTPCQAIGHQGHSHSSLFKRLDGPLLAPSAGAVYEQAEAGNCGWGGTNGRGPKMHGNPKHRVEVPCKDKT